MEKVCPLRGKHDAGVDAPLEIAVRVAGGSFVFSRVRRRQWFKSKDGY